MKARDAIQPGETAVAIFTRGDRFKLTPDGNGTTGNWVISQRRRIDKVIIYRQDNRGHHEVFVGTPIEIVPSPEAGRREIRMGDVRFVGTTTDNWHAFTDTKPGAINPVKYVRRS